MELAHLRAFVTVAEERHFGRAALRLELSQPQVSRQVRALEAELGVELFVRTARQNELTEAGLLLLPDAQEALAASRRIADRASLARRWSGGRVAVAFLWSTLSHYLPQLVAASAERHPEIELAVSQLTYNDVLPALRRGDVDLVIGRAMWQEHEMTELVLRREPSVLAVPESDPLAREEHVELTVLSGAPLIVLQRALIPAAYDAIMTAARDRGVEIHVVQHVRSQSEALALVSAGIGVHRLPATAARPHPGVVYVPFSDTPSRLTLLHRPLISRAVRTLVELAGDLFGDAPDASQNAPVALARGASDS